MRIVFALQVNRFEGEKVALARDISNTNSKLLDAKVTICDLEEECVSLTIV